MDAWFTFALALEAIPIGLIALADRPAPGGRRGLVRGTVRGFNCCERCGRPLPVDAVTDWRLAGACARCGAVQEWALPREGGPAAPVVPWTRREPATPARRPVARPGAPAAPTAPARRSARPAAQLTPPRRGRPRSVPAGIPPIRPTAPRGVPGRIPAGTTPARTVPPGRTPPTPVPPGRGPVPGRQPGPPPRVLPPERVRPPRPARDPAGVDPFVLEPAARAAGAVEPATGERSPRHRPRPERRGFRREAALDRVSAAFGQKGFNCCEECGDPLPREPEREWRYAGTCPRCGHVQVWAT